MNNLTKEEIKAITTVQEVLQRFGVEVKRGRCRGFCHGGKDLNVKVSDGFYFCYVCNKGMDIFDITMELNHCDFHTAFELLGGTEKPSFTTTIKANKARREREQRVLKERRNKAELGQITSYITAYRNIMQEENRMSELYAYCYNKLQYQLYLLELQTEKR